MKVKVVVCETCHDATLYLDGKLVQVDRLVTPPKTTENHSGFAVEWETT